MINKPSGDKSHISVHNVVHPYCFTKDMLTGMRVLRQLDDKFIVGVFSQGGKTVHLIKVYFFKRFHNITGRCMLLRLLLYTQWRLLIKMLC